MRLRSIVLSTVFAVSVAGNIYHGLRSRELRKENKEANETADKLRDQNDTLISLGEVKAGRGAVLDILTSTNLSPDEIKKIARIAEVDAEDNTEIHCEEASDPVLCGLASNAYKEGVQSFDRDAQKFGAIAPQPER